MNRQAHIDINKSFVNSIVIGILIQKMINYQSNYNTKHEVDAYRAQWSWSNNGFYLETTLNENGQLITPFKINRKFIYTILNKQKKLLYENLPY